jgi:AcrR family transcriptional regulator
MVRQADRKAAHRAAILDAAEALVSVELDAPSMEEIAELAGVAKGTLYNHFADKSDLLQAVAARVRRDAAGRVAREIAKVNGAAERLALGMSVYVRLAQESPRRAALLVRMAQDAMNPLAPMNAALRSEIDRGNDRGELAAYPVEAGVLTVLALVQHAMILASGGPGRAPSPKAAFALVSFALRALGVAEVEARRIAERSDPGGAPADTRPE